MSEAYLDETSRVITVKIHDQETLIGRKVEILQTCLHKLEGSCLGSLGFRHSTLIDDETSLGIERIVDGHEGIAFSQTSPHGLHGIDGSIRRIILSHLLEMLLEARHLS